MSEDKPRLKHIIETMGNAESKSNADRALICLLKRWFHEIPEYEDNGYFQKMFRQCDVVDECEDTEDFHIGGLTDMAIYHLLHESDLFWTAAAPRDTGDSDETD